MTQSYLQRGSYNPRNTTDPSTDRIYNQQFNNLNRKEQQELTFAASAGDGLKQLAGFSKTLGEGIIRGIEKKAKKDYAEGLALAYEQDVPQSSWDAYNEEKGKLKAADVEIEKFATKQQKLGVSQEVVQKIKGMSKWKAYGLATGMAKSAAMDYQGFLEGEFATNDTFQIELPDGRFITPKTAKTNAEKAAALSALRNKFFEENELTDINPMILGEHAFPSMKKVDAAIMADTRLQNRIEESAINQDTIIKTLETEGDLALALDSLQSEIDGSGNKLGYKGAWNLIDDYIEDRAETGNISLEELNKYREQKSSNSNGKKMGEFYKNKFDRYEEIIKNKAFNNEVERKKIAKQDYIKKMNDAVAAKEDGQPLTLEERKAFIAEWDYNDGPLPDDVKDFFVVEDIDQNIAVERLQYKLTNRIPIYEEDLKGIYEADVYSRWSSLAKDSRDFAIPEDIKGMADESIKALVNAHREESDANKAKTPLWVANKQRMEIAYKNEYAKAIQVESDPMQAHLTALDKVTENLVNGKYDSVPTASVDQTHELNLSLAQNAISKDANIITTKVIPGTEEALKRAIENPNEVQTIYTQIAAKHPITPHELQQRQIEAAGGKPIVSEIEEQVKKLPPEIQILLKLHPTPARVQRAKVEAFMEDGDVSYDDLEFLIDEVREKQVTPEITQGETVLDKANRIKLLR